MTFSEHLIMIIIVCGVGLVVSFAIVCVISFLQLINWAANESGQLHFECLDKSRPPRH